jgi:hypothetical protein
VTAFSVGSGGTLVALGSYPTGGSGSGGGLVAAPRARLLRTAAGRLLVTNTGSNDITVFDVLPGGSLAPVPGSPFPFPPGPYMSGAIALDREGRFLYAGTLIDSIVKFSVAQDGSLTPLLASPSGPFGRVNGLEVHPCDGSLALSLSDTNWIEIVDADTLAPIPGSPVRAGGLAVAGLDFNSDGSLLFAGNALTFGTQVAVLQSSGIGGDCSPVVTCPPPSTSECAAPTGTAVTLTAQVLDKEGDALTVTWSVDGSGVRTDSIPAGPPPTTATVSLSRAYSVGVHGVSIVASDGSSAGACSTAVTVRDTRPPVLTCSAPSLLVGPNHDLVTAGLQAKVTDCDPNPTLRVDVFGDEDDTDATGGPTQSPDAKDLAIGTLRLRAERNTSGDGRVYLMVTRATDAAGLTAFDCCTTTVPLKSDKASLAAVSSQASAARTYCLAHGGAPPPGYFVVGDGPVLGSKQ